MNWAAFSVVCGGLCLFMALHVLSEETQPELSIADIVLPCLFVLVTAGAFGMLNP